MPTSARDRLRRKRREDGFTLLELLIVLALMALGAGIAATSVSVGAPDRALRLAGETLEADLKAARLAARTSMAPVSVVFSDDSYAISALGLERQAGRGVSFALEGASSTEIIFEPGVDPAAKRIRLQAKGRTQIVEAAPITGRITAYAGE